MKEMNIPIGFDEIEAASFNTIKGPMQCKRMLICVDL